MLNPNIGGKKQKWMVKIMENPIKMDDLGGTIIFGTPIYLNIRNHGFMFLILLMEEIRLTNLGHTKPCK